MQKTGARRYPIRTLCGPPVGQDRHVPVFLIRKPALRAGSGFPGNGGSTSRAVTLCCVSQDHGVREYGFHRISGTCASYLGSDLSHVHGVCLPDMVHRTQENPAACSVQTAF